MIIPLRVKNVPKREFHPFVPPSPQPEPQPEPIEGYTMAIFSDDFPAYLAEDTGSGPDESYIGPFKCDGVDYDGIFISGQVPHNVSYVLSWKEPADGGGPDEAVQVTDDGAFLDQKYRYVFVADGEDLETFAINFSWLIEEDLIEFDPPLPEPEPVVGIGLASNLDFTGMSDKTWTLDTYTRQNLV